MTPTVMVFSLSLDSRHLLGMVSFHGLDRGASRNIVMTYANNVDGFAIAPAGDQAHLPNPEPYVAETDRILRGILALTFPHGGLGSGAAS